MNARALTENGLSSPLVMSSLDIAELTGKQHAHVCRDIRCMFQQLDDPDLDHHAVLDSRGYIAEYSLPRRECEILITGYDVKRRAAVIDRWHELETGQSQPRLSNPQSTLEMIALMATEAAKVEQRQKVLEAKQDKLEEGFRELTEVGAPPPGYLCLSDFADLELSNAKLKAVIKANKIESRKYKYQTPKGIVQTNTAYYADQVMSVVERILREATQVTRYYWSHPEIGRFQRRLMD